MNEIDIKSADLKVLAGQIIFSNYVELYDQALQLKSYIESVEVTEESIKATKKMLAAVNGKVKELEDKRIEVKKLILSPYTDFESQVKQIVNTVREADSEVRKKVKALEELERDEKELLIVGLFNKRKPLYPDLFMFSIDDFLTAKHLNKTTSLKLIEEEMVTWFESRKRDLEIINTLDLSTEILTEYKDSLDLSVSMKVVNDRKARQQAMEQSKPESKEPLKFFKYTIFNKKDAMLLDSFLKELNIEHKKEGI